MQSLEAAVTRLEHVATRRQLLALGYSPHQLAAAVRSGAVVRPRRGWYVASGASRPQMLAVRLGGQLSHSSAAASHGLWAGFDRRVHVALTRSSSRVPRVPPGVVVHWTRPGRREFASGLNWRVSADEALRQVVATSDRETAVACLDTARTSLRLGDRDLRRMFQHEPPRSRARVLLSRAGSESGAESLTRQRLLRIGIVVRQQVPIAGVGRLDMLIGRRVNVEIDGRAFHGDAASFESDRRRDSLLVERGYIVLRFSYRQVIYDWPAVERVILATLHRAKQEDLGLKGLLWPL